MWHVSCKNCGTFDIVWPGTDHPAAEVDPETGQFTLTDRTALRHAHDDDCQPDAETGHYPLHFTFIATAGAPAGGGE